MKKTLYFLLISFVILIVFSLFFWLYEVKFFVGRASVNQATFSIDNSYIFITPLRASANGQEKIRLTIFVLSNQGLGVANKTVTLAQDKALTIETIQNTTDSYGKAYFDITTTNKGEYYLDVNVEGTSLNQKAHLSFY
jgi:hypothetical protein